MKKKNIKIIIVVLLIALIGAIAILSKKVGLENSSGRGKNDTENGISIEDDNERKNSNQNSNQKKGKSESDIKKESSHKVQTDNKSHGKKKDIGGGLYVYEDGTIETEVIPIEEE